jgi:hypothetical protein
MAVRTLSRDASAGRTILVWPKGVLVEDVKQSSYGFHYATVNGALVQPAQIPADVFKAAFGFIPVTGSIARYVMRKAVAPQTLEARLASAIRDVVKAELGDD